MRRLSSQSAWSTQTLASICEAIIDCPHSTPRWTDSGVVVLRNQNIRNGRLNLTTPSFTDEENYEQRSRRARLRAGDLVITREAPMGEVCMVPPGLRCCLGQRMVMLRPTRAKCDPRFLLYSLQSPAVQHDIRVNEGTGSTVSNLRIPLLKNLPIPLPPLSIQRRIAEILGSLDDKIELNRRMNQTLEAMARAIFKSWFIGFDPVRAKAVDFIADGVLEIGDGYRAKNSELTATGIPFVRAGDLQTGFNLESAERLGLESVAKARSKICRSGDVAFTSKGTVGRLARVDASLPKFVYSPQICYWRSLNKLRLHPSILYCWMCSEDFLRQVRAFSGQTDMAPYISLRDQRQILVPEFPDSQLELGGRIELLLQRQAAAHAESQTLAEVRDTLLPKLLSGTIRSEQAIDFARPEVSHG